MKTIKASRGNFWLLYVCVFSSLTVILMYVTGHLSADTAKSSVEMLVNVTKLLMLVGLK